jgi:putative NADPH-quinone reductase
MSRNILVVNGHPDPRPERFCAALCDAYEEGARARGYATRRLDVGALQLSSLAIGGAEGHGRNDPLNDLEQAFRLLRAADRLAIVYPLWADAPPAELRQMFDFVARLGAHLEAPVEAKAARVLVTTALPGFFYRGKLDEDGLALSGVAPAEPTFIGAVEAISCGKRIDWLERVRGFGAMLS